MSFVIEDRKTAGRDLARALSKYRKHADVVVLALPRGGVPVAAEIAHELHAPLDILVVRKLGTPGHEELAMGAIASGGIRVLNPDIIESLGIGSEALEVVAAREQRELERRMKAYRGERPWPAIEDKRVILVDDGIATGATMRAAIAALRTQHPARVTIAVPVAPFQTITQLRRQADEVVCLATPEPFHAIGMWYRSFPQTSNDEVRGLLSERWAAENEGAGVAAQSPVRSGSRRAVNRNGTRQAAPRPTREEEVRVAAGSVHLEGTLRLPGSAHGLVVFAHGSGSGRFSPRNRYVAECLNEVGLATLLFDLLTPREQQLDDRTGELRFDIGLLTDRLTGAVDWIGTEASIRSLPLGIFGASTGAAAALNTAAARPEQVAAVVSRGGRPDLAQTSSLALVRAPTLLIVGGFDDVVIGLNEQAAARLKCEHRVEIVPGASHLFEESGKLEAVARLARDGFERYLQRAAVPAGVIAGATAPR